MSTNGSLERALAEHEQRNQRENYFTRFSALKQHLLNNVYPQVMSGFPGGNDHGPAHIVRVLEYLGQLIGEDMLSVLDPYELFIAMMAILWHDVGILQGRDQHARTSESLLNVDSNDYLFNDEDRELTRIAVASHSSSIDIEEKCSGFLEEQTVRGRKIRIRMVSALVRLADEMDEDVRRAEPSVAKLFERSKESDFHWKFNQRISGIQPHPNRKEISVHIGFKPEDLEETRQDAKTGKPIRFIEFFFEKIAKLNRERISCNKYLPEGLKYSSIQLAIKPFPGDPTWKNVKQIIVNNGTTSLELINSLPPVFSRPWGLKPTSTIAAQVAVGHKFLEHLPHSAMSPPLSLQNVASEIGNCFHVKTEAVLNVARHLYISVRTASRSKQEIKALFLNIACMVSAFEEIDFIEVSASDSRDLFGKVGVSSVVLGKIVFDRKIMHHLVMHRELPSDFWAATRVYFLNKDNDVDMAWDSIPLVEFE